MPSKRFRIAFSFAGEKRKFVQSVADLLAKKFGKEHILYDKYHEAEFARSDLGIYLPKLYNEQADLIVVVLCPQYDEKEWTGLEWLAIHDLLQKRRRDEILLSRFERANVDGLFGGAGFIEADDKTPGQFAMLILERLALNEKKARNHYLEPALITPAFEPPPSPRGDKPSIALQKWLKKRDFLEYELAIVSNAAEKFELQERIEEANVKIAELSR